MSKISPLRQRFIQDMQLAGFVEGTQANYLRNIQAFVRRCGNIPPQFMTEQQVEAYIHSRLKTVARGTFQAEFGALRFLFYNTLLREWPIFTKKKSAGPFAFDCRSPSRTTNAAR